LSTAHDRPAAFKQRADRYRTAPTLSVDAVELRSNPVDIRFQSFCLVLGRPYGDLIPLIQWLDDILDTSMGTRPQGSADDRARHRWAVLANALSRHRRPRPPNHRTTNVWLLEERTWVSKASFSCKHGSIRSA